MIALSTSKRLAKERKILLEEVCKQQLNAMGSYADIKIDGHSIFQMKSYVDPHLMTFFEECDLTIMPRALSSDKDDADESLEEDEEENLIYKYELELRHAKQRLDIQGFTLGRAVSAFNESIAEQLQYLAEHGFSPGLWEMDESEQESLLESYTFEFWKEQLTIFLNSGVDRSINRDHLATLHPAQKLIGFLDSEYYIWGLPNNDPRLIIRSLLEVFPDSSKLSLNYTELVESGYYEDSDRLVSQSKATISHEFVRNSKTVILTEGSTDALFLAESLKILFPHLFPLFSFLDFHEPRLAGGASSLVHVLKGFVGAQVANRVVAILDNDTAAEDALRALDSVTLPDRFIVLRYPSLPIGESYPTLGPQGATHMDVNGLAGSIELYFGEDVLRDDSGNLAFVQWKGYNQTLRKYQGELMDKQALQDRFTQKLRSASSSGFAAASADWSGMTAIWESIFAACVSRS